MRHLGRLEDVMGSHLKNPTERNTCIAMILFLVSLIMSGVTFCEGQINPKGFTSIDCGSPEEDYVDPQTNLTWTGDGSYIQIGKSGVTNFTAVYESNTRLNYTGIPSLKYFIYFPMNRSKYCYELPLTQNTTTFLLRATFLHSNTSELDPHTRFKIYVNTTLWVTVQYGEGDYYTMGNFKSFQKEVREGIFLNTGVSVVNVCLVRDLGIPFISSLELRELDYEGVLYSEDLFDERGQSYFLANVLRWNMAAQGDTLKNPIRYPYDSCDRIWEYHDHYGYDCSSTNLPLSQLNFSTTQVNLSLVNNLPLKAMECGWSIENRLYPLSFLFPDSFFKPDSVTSSIFYFHSNQSSLPVRVDLNNQLWKSWNSTNKLTAESLFHKIPGSQDSSSQVGSVGINSILDVPLQLLALEVYQANQFMTKSTDLHTQNFVDFIKENLNMSDWQGDPCIPVAHDWIQCDIDVGTKLFLTSITLSQRSMVNSTRTTEFMPSSINSLFLTQVSITQCNISYDIIIKIVASGPVQFLYKMNHHILPCNFGCAFHFAQQMCFWNLSYSYITADSLWSTSVDYSLFRRVEILDLSYNQIRRAPLEWELSALFGISNEGGSISLQELNISNNNMTGEFPLTWFLLWGVDHKIINADHNHISGRLNITMWCQSIMLQHLSSNFTTSEDFGGTFQKLFSFVNNNIIDVAADLEAFESKMNISLLIQYFNRFSSGILLGGNPYCENAKHLFHRYLCRSSTTDKSYEINQKSKRKDNIYAGVFGGLAFIIMGVCILYLVVQSHEQKRKAEAFEKALAAKDVHFRFYRYVDLKRATWNFTNKLGSGGFGDVYKGVLEEGGKDKTIAVKILANKQEEEEEEEEEEEREREKGEEEVEAKDPRALFISGFLSEVSPFKTIKHKNLVDFLGWSLKKKKRILVFEFVEGGDIASVLWGSKSQGQGILNWDERLKICLGVAKGLAYLHTGVEPCIIHRDIKAANILLDRKLKPKIADFGLARFVHEGDNQAEYTQRMGTKEYAAPEYLLKEGPLTEKYDVYSFGVLLLEIISGRKCEDKNQDIDKWFLKGWFTTLQQKETQLELLQPELKEKCRPLLELLQPEFKEKCHPSLLELLRPELRETYHHLLELLQPEWKEECHHPLLELLQPELKDECHHDNVIKVINIAISCLKHDPMERPAMDDVQHKLKNLTKDTKSRNNLSNSEMNTSSTQEMKSFDIEDGGGESSRNENRGWSFVRSVFWTRFKGRETLTDVSEGDALVPRGEGQSSEGLKAVTLLSEEDAWIPCGEGQSSDRLNT